MAGVLFSKGTKKRERLLLGREKYTLVGDCDVDDGHPMWCHKYDEYSCLCGTRVRRGAEVAATRTRRSFGRHLGYVPNNSHPLPFKDNHGL